MKPSRQFTLFFILFTFIIASHQAQELENYKQKTSDDKLGTIKQLDETTATGDKISFKDGTTSLVEIESYYGGGLIHISPTPNASVASSALYNVGGNLYWGLKNLSALTSGASSLNDLSDGKTNASSIYLGLNTGSTITSGVNNNALGIDALKLNTSGSSNNAIGINALGLNTEGNANEAFGNSALYRNTTGSGNIGIGNFANFNNQTGSNNTIVGYRAGFGTQLHNKSGNVFLGYNAGYNEEGSNKLYIENSNSSTPLIYGDFTDNSEMVKINGDLYSEGKAYGGNFSASNNGGVAVYAVATDANNNLFQGNTGGRFEARAGEGIGLRGIASNSGNFTNYGGFFAANGAMGRGVYATAPLTGFAGYFDGNLHVTGNITSDGSSPADNTWTTSSNDIFNANSGNVGIGTSSVGVKLHVKSSSEIIRMESSTDNGWLSIYNNTGAGSQYLGYIGAYNGTNDIDIGTSGSGANLNLVTGATPRFIIANDGSAGLGALNGGRTLNVRGISSDQIAFGVEDPSSNARFLVSNDGHVGINYFVPNRTFHIRGNTGDGLYFMLEDPTGQQIFKVFPSGDAIFVYNLSVGGTISTGAKSFKIDHPLDPTNKYLLHTSIESSDMMNVYNGNVTLNANGEAIVTMADWFEALNKDFKYQLTAIGAPGPNLYIAEKINGNQFRIAGGTAGMEVSWQVTGVRQDAYANENRIQVEEFKKPEERGKYLHPTAFGQPKEMGISHSEELKRQEQIFEN